SSVFFIQPVPVSLLSLSLHDALPIYLSAFGPLSFLLLLGVWAAGIIAGFAMLQWGLQNRLNTGQSVTSFLTYLYMSGTTFFTLGDRKSTRLNSSHLGISYAVFCLKKK